jgi:hypothetical protein
MAEGQSAIVADLGANLVCVLLILLAVAAIQTRQGTKGPPIPAQRVAPLSGPAQSDLLYLRLRPDPRILTVEVAETGPLMADRGILRPLTALPRPLPDRVVAYVFSAKGYAALRGLVDAAALPMDEITVPEALRSPAPIAGQSGFSQAFLSLPVTDDPISIRPALLRLLTDGGTAAALKTAETKQGWLASAWLLFRQAGNLTLMLIAVLTLRLCYRRLRS